MNGGSCIKIGAAGRGSGQFRRPREFCFCIVVVQTFQNSLCKCASWVKIRVVNLLRGLD